MVNDLADAAWPGKLVGWIAAATQPSMIRAMWPFRPEKSRTADDLLSEAIRAASARWLAFREEAGLPANLSLRDQIAYFARPLRDELGRAFPRLAAADDQILLLVIANGIEGSGTHSRGQIERQLGIVLPP